MNIKKIVLRTVPYVCIALYGTKIGQAWRLAAGTAFAEKLLHWGDGFMQALASPLPSFHPQDMLAGMAIAAAFYAAVYVKSKNAKKFRHNVEYGSARWGTAKDIEPYVDPAFANNIILTQTERLTMNSRPKDPRTARNKNVLVVGGSGSGKTRFFVKPNLMQCVSEKYPCSFVVTDPKGSLIVESGRMLRHFGYRIKVMNTINFAKSMHYNPLAYIHSEKDILKLVNCLIANTRGEGKGGDPFWEKSEVLLYTALIGYLWQEALEEDRNFATLIDMIGSMQTREDNEDFRNPIDLMFEDLEREKPDCFAVRQYKKFKLAAGVVCSKYPLNHEIFS